MLTFLAEQETETWRNLPWNCNNTIHSTSIQHQFEQFLTLKAVYNPSRGNSYKPNLKKALDDMKNSHFTCSQPDRLYNITYK